MFVIHILTEKVKNNYRFRSATWN